MLFLTICRQSQPLECQIEFVIIFFRINDISVFWSSKYVLIGKGGGIFYNFEGVCCAENTFVVNSISWHYAKEVKKNWIWTTTLLAIFYWPRIGGVTFLKPPFSSKHLLHDCSAKNHFSSFNLFYAIQGANRSEANIFICMCWVVEYRACEWYPSPHGSTPLYILWIN